MRPSSATRPEYLAAFTELVRRIADPLRELPKQGLPIKMYVAGGAAMHFYTAERVSNDIDAVFSRRIVLPDDLEIAYQDADGRARLLYFDRQYNDTFSLTHEDAHDDSIPLSLKQIDASVLDVRLLSALDLAVSKISRSSSQDHGDIAALAKHGLIRSAALRRRAVQAMGGYVGNLDTLKGAIDIACRLVEDAERRASR
ncbi:MAG TPA: DUF6036 family nucleotidyltransferase [Steroidobacteraceae bacterium]|jgi:hypothetical protein|nr:DUF6036 family nucleotidyltransferase [Steroidobacteraceae bacterium]